MGFAVAQPNLRQNFNYWECLSQTNSIKQSTNSEKGMSLLIALQSESVDA
ncbi:hypothetical protein [Okeania sp. SIO2B9]|nr:hypothetical protein [Okeania sp. SIO2B9]